METMRLRALQAPMPVGELLREIPGLASPLPPGTMEITTLGGLPAALQKKARDGEENGFSWIAFDYGRRSSLYLGEMALEQSREHGHPVLRVTEYGEDGQLRATHDWLVLGPGKIVPCSD